MNEETRADFILRARIVTAIRRYLDGDLEEFDGCLLIADRSHCLGGSTEGSQRRDRRKDNLLRA